MIAATLARHHWRSLAGTFIALVLGVTLLATTLIIFVSAGPQVPLRYAAAPVLVSAQPPGTEPEHSGWQRPWSSDRADQLAAAVAAVPGVRSAVVDHSFHAQLVVDGELVTHADDRDRQGHNWSSAILGDGTLRAGSAPTGADEVVVGDDLGLAVGDTAELLLASESRTVRVSGVLDSAGVWLADPAAERAAAGPQALGVLPEPAADSDRVAAAIQDVVGTDGTVLTGSERAGLESEADSSDRYVGAQFLIMMAVITAFVSVFVIATTIAFVVAQRRRELGLLRLQGATPGQVHRMILTEAALVAIPAGALGAVLGAALASPVGGWMVEHGMQPEGWSPRTVLLPALGAWGLGLAVAVLGTGTAAGRAARTRPMEALREAAVDERPIGRVRLLLGLLSVAAALVLGVASRGIDFEYVGAATTGAACSALLGAALLAPAYLPRLLRGLTAWSERTRGPVGHLVREGSSAAVRRVASTMVPVLLTMGLVAFVTGMVATMSDTIARANLGGIQTTHAAAPRAGSPGVTDAALAAIDRAGSDRTMSLLTSWVMVGAEPATQRRLGLNGLDPTMFDHLAGAVVDGSTARLGEPGTVAVSLPTLERYGLARGDAVPVTWPDGSADTLEVVAVFEGESAAALLPRDRVRAHDPTALAPVVYVDGLDPATVNPDLSRVGVELITAVDYQAAGEQEEENLFRLFTWGLLLLAVGYTGLAVANTMVMATRDRRRDFALLRLTGAHRRQVLQVVVTETALVVTVGAVLGVLCAVPAVVGISQWMAADFDVAARVLLDWPAVALAGVGCLLMAVVASILPARATMATPAVAAVTQ